MRNFTFSKKWYDILKEYPKELQYAVYAAVLEYVFTGVCVDMEPAVRMAFDFIKYDIDERARLREVRRAKTEEKGEPTETCEDIGELSEEALVKEYYEKYDSPKPVRMLGGAGNHRVGEERIRSLVKMSVKDLLRDTHYKPGSEEFFSRLRYMVVSRFEVICQEMKRYSGYSAIGESCWSDMFKTARLSCPAYTVD